MNQKTVVVIGGGAAGMVAAITAARQGAKVTILEKNDRVGRKLLATGNGKCNFSNSFCTFRDYAGENAEFIRAALSGFDLSKTLDFFEGLGIIHREESGGRLYPYSEQGSSVLDALREELACQNIEIIFGSRVVDVFYADPLYTVTTEKRLKLTAHAVILTTGGKAGPQYGSTGDGYDIASALGHMILEPRPALVQMASDQKFFSQLKGVRAKGTVILLQNLEILASETGEIQFTESGLSGICIFDISRFMQRLQDPRECSISIDFMPEWNEQDLNAMFTKRIMALEHSMADHLLNGILHKKLIPVVLRECKISPQARIKELKNLEIARLVKLLKDWRIPVVGTRGWEDAQVTTGGVSTNEVNPVTMESRIASNLYFAGEILDVDGKCGGFNLQWAWTSGALAGQHAGQQKDGLC